MKANTNIQLEYINIDGELDPSFVRKQRTAATIGHIARFGHNVASLAGTALESLYVPVLLEITDHRNGTKLREQYFANKRQAEATAVAETFGLRVE